MVRETREGPVPVLDGERLLRTVKLCYPYVAPHVGKFATLLAERLREVRSPLLYAYAAEQLVDDCSRGKDLSNTEMPGEVTGLPDDEYNQLSIYAWTWATIAFPEHVSAIEESYFDLRDGLSASSSMSMDEFRFIVP